MGAGKPSGPSGSSQASGRAYIRECVAMLERQDGVEGRSLWLETQTREQGSYELLK